MSYFKREGGQNVGAVTGNMLVSNRTTLTALVQMNELNSIVGMIKRSQMAYGGLFAFSGANTMYRKAVVFDVGGFQAEQPTEDIAIAWDMQTNGWQPYLVITFASSWICQKPYAQCLRNVVVGRQAVFMSC